ncbi:MAG: WYL domain-containing protein [Planctomycetota bacterium]
MSDKPNPARAARVRVLLGLLSEQPLPAEELLPRLNRSLTKEGLPQVQRRMLQLDLAWMRERLGADVVELVSRSQLDPQPPAAFRHHRRFYRLAGAESVLPVSGDIIAVTELEVLALHAARAVLAAPPAPSARQTTDEGPLSAALGRLLGRLGLGSAKLPDVLGVNPAAPQPWDPVHALTVLRAIRVGDAVTMRYQSLGKEAHDVVAQPIRLVLTDGEPYLWAWDDAAKKLKNYKLARVSTMNRRPALSNVPAGLDSDVRGQLASSFRGVAGKHQRGRVVLRLAHDAVPHVRDRRLGPAQTWEELSDGGARVSFNTHGLEMVRHWVLQFGPRVVVEEPQSLADWVRDEAKRTAAVYA